MGRSRTDPELLRWLSRSQVPLMMEELVRALLVHKPDRPLEYMRKRVEKRYNVVARTDASATPLTPQPPAGKTGDGQPSPQADTVADTAAATPSNEEGPAKAVEPQAPAATAGAKTQGTAEAGVSETVAAPDAAGAATDGPVASSSSDTAGAPAGESATQEKGKADEKPVASSSAEAVPAPSTNAGNNASAASAPKEDEAREETTEWVTVDGHDGRGRVVGETADGKLRVVMEATGEEVVADAAGVAPELEELDAVDIRALVALAEQTDAATKMQKVFRGHAARKDVKKKKAAVREARERQDAADAAARAEAEAEAVAAAAKASEIRPVSAGATDEEASVDDGDDGLGEFVTVPSRGGAEGRIVEVLDDGRVKVRLSETLDVIEIARTDVEEGMPEIDLGALTKHAISNDAATKIQAQYRGRLGRKRAADKKALAASQSRSSATATAPADSEPTPAPAAEEPTGPPVPTDMDFSDTDEPTPAGTPPQCVYAIRHGHRLDDADPTWTSDRPYDPPLTDEGHVAAVTVGARLAKLPEWARPSYVVSSPFTRCVETAVGVARALGVDTVVVHGALGEVHDPQVLKADVRPAFTLPQRLHGIRIEEAPSSTPPPYPEDRAAAFQRYADAFATLPDLAADRHVVLVTHGEAVGQSVQSLHPELTVYSTPYCSYTVRCRTDGGWRLKMQTKGKVEWMAMDGE